MVGTSTSKRILRRLGSTAGSISRLPLSSPRAWSRQFTQHQCTQGPIDVHQLLERPTWSVETLLPPADDEATTGAKGDTDLPNITSKQLHHLLRLSALPPPASPEEEAEMLKTLRAQLHFVDEIRKVDTTGVKPLQSLRDETAAGYREEEVGFVDLKDAFEQEEIKGSYHKKIRRRQDMPEDTEGAAVWDVLGLTRKRAGRYFVVEGGKAGTE
ncbi:hypothetical protein AAFC00_007245 [Neodothiora populina]|uniref:Glutamyl-tRNA amidotransferase complex subunit Gta3 domain-containing protein n=1 Tax=Neodothiora populina TaxID=2781224 RepID=A0ABR3PHN3_9PEZI